MKILPNYFVAQVSRSLSLTVVALATMVSAHQLRAASGSELLMSSLSSSEMNKTIIDCESLNGAVTKAVTTSREQAPEIVAVAITKTRSLACQRSLVQASIRALGDYKALPKNTIPNIVGAAIRASSNCGSDEGRSGYAKSDMGGCECAEQFTKAAIEVLADPSEGLVTDITAAAIQATGGKCAERIVAAATAAAPQYASAIADIGASASNGTFTSDSFNGGDPLVFGPNGVSPAPLPQSFGPGTVSGTPVTPVANL